ncbi:hypothetical protein ACTMTJ_17615 [Phytohabitans sp. LJ34]|uniref:hypothetical protein n=1 Tax=Phytohabitans sp. LJ34 TaxID=3452217 RepID=UPI003F8B8395
MARYLAALLAFTANTQVGIPETHLAYDASDGVTHRDFLEVFVPDERGHPGEGRLVRTDEITAVFVGMDTAPDGARISRALHQYSLALRYWYFGGEWLALAHLYMAVENLTKAVIRRRCQDAGIDEEALAESQAIDTSDSSKWPHRLEVWARREIIFDGNVAAYNRARNASDGVEHGFMEMNKVYEYALATTEITFGYVRRTMLRLVGIDQAGQPDLYDRPPRDVQSLRKMIRGQFIGDGADPAPAGEEYPYLKWNSNVKTMTRDGDKFSLSFEEKFRVYCAPSYTFTGQAFEVRGRAETGSPIRLDTVIEVTKTPPTLPTSEAFDLMQRATSFAKTVAAHGQTSGIPPLLLNVFGLSAVQLSVFEAIEVLLRRNSLAETLVLLRNLITGTCRLQTIANDPNPIGVAIRLKLDALERQIALYPTDENVAQLVGGRIAEYRRAATKRGIAIPDSVPDITSTEFYCESANTLRFTEEVAQGDELAIALHTRTEDDGSQGIHTTLPDDKMVRGIAADSASALVVSFVSLAIVLGWSFDRDVASALEADAQRLGADE